MISRLQRFRTKSVESKFLLFAFCFLNFALVSAQDFAILRGTLKNAKGRPLDFVNITVKEQQELASQSDEKGNYEEYHKSYLKIDSGCKT